jgi:hypothetical protein
MERPAIGAALIEAQDKQAARAKKPKKKPYGQVLTITPEMAAEWLESSSGNRKIALSEIKAMARDMDSGDFDLNGDMLRFDWNRRFRDGHKRLRACVESGRPFESFVAFDLDPKVFRTVDIGTPRTGAQTLLGGEFGVAKAYDNNVMSGVVSWMLDLYAGQPGGGRKEFKPSIPETLRFIQDNPLLIDAVRYGISARRTYKAISANTWAVAWYLCTDEGRKHITTERFFNAIQTGVGLTADHPALLIRERMMASVQARNTKNRKGVLTRHQVLALLILGYNCHVNMMANMGESTMTIPSDLRNNFPVPIGVKAPWATAPTAGQLELA